MNLHGFAKRNPVSTLVRLSPGLACSTRPRQLELLPVPSREKKVGVEVVARQNFLPPLTLMEVEVGRECLRCGLQLIVLLMLLLQ
jgi:hypothetical protein